jgi:hypothetical protein
MGWANPRGLQQYPGGSEPSNFSGVAIPHFHAIAPINFGDRDTAHPTRLPEGLQRRQRQADVMRLARQEIPLHLSSEWRQMPASCDPCDITNENGATYLFPRNPYSSGS